MITVQMIEYIEKVCANSAKLARFDRRVYVAQDAHQRGVGGRSVNDRSG